MKESTATITPRRRAPRHRSRQGHLLVTQAADVGIHAWASSLEPLFEEAAAALAEIATDVDVDVPPEAVPVEIEADDLEQLAFWWLNELMALAHDRRALLAGSNILTIEWSANEFILRGRGWFAPSARRPAGVAARTKAVTMSRLRVARVDAGWELEADLDG